jgi:ABC-2 type transport system ATP-binding protein
MMIELKKLRKCFGRRVALDNLSLNVPRGQIYGLLGHNGAGKSTTIGLLLGHLVPDEGDAFIGGVSVNRDRGEAICRTGAIFEAPAFYDYLSGHRNLLIFSQYSGDTSPARLAEVIHLVGLEQRIHEPVKRYSHGMRQRLALAQALLPDPDLLVLDEPTDGLDPEGIHEMRTLVQRLNRESGLTILLSSHLLGEVEHLCHQVGILYEGHLLFNGDWREVNDSALCRLRVDEPVRASQLLKANNLVTDLSELVDGPAEQGKTKALELRLADGVPLSAVAAALADGNLAVHALYPAPPSLEDFYLETLKNWRQR